MSEIRNNYKKLMYVINYQIRKNTKKVDFIKSSDKQKALKYELSKLKQQFNLVTNKLNSKETAPQHLQEKYSSILNSSIDAIKNLKKIQQDGKQH